MKKIKRLFLPFTVYISTGCANIC